jgi:hypothetical protein
VTSKPLGCSRNGNAEALAEEELVFRRCLEFAYGYGLVAVVASDESSTMLGFTIRIATRRFLYGAFRFHLAQ